MSDLVKHCVKAHDLCHLGGPCPYCENTLPLRDKKTGKFKSARAALKGQSNEQ